MNTYLLIKKGDLSTFHIKTNLWWWIHIYLLRKMKTEPNRWFKKNVLFYYSYTFYKPSWKDIFFLPDLF